MADFVFDAPSGAPDAPAAAPSTGDADNQTPAAPDAGRSLMDQLGTLTPPPSSGPAPDAAPADAPKAAEPTPAAAPAAATPPAAAPNWTELLTGENADAAASHLAGGKFKTAAELNAALADPYSLLPESEQALLAHLRSGAKFADVAAVLDRDWTTTPDLDVARAAWDRAHPEYTDPEDREYEWDQHIASKFPNALVDDPTDPAVRSDQRKLKVDADEARAIFTTEQAKYKALPSAQNTADAQAAQQATTDAAIKQWFNEVDTFIPNFKSLPVEYDTPTGRQTATLDTTVLSPQERQGLQMPFETLFDRWQKTDGSGLDPAKVAPDMLRLLRLEAVTTLAVTQGRALESSDWMRRLQNPSAAPDTQASGNQPLLQQLAGGGQTLNVQASRS